MKLHAVRIENRNLGDICNSDRYSNPLGAVGRYKDARAIEVFLFQERKEYLSEEEILKVLLPIFNKKYPKEQTKDIDLFRFFLMVGGADEMIPREGNDAVKFLESSKL